MGEGSLSGTFGTLKRWVSIPVFCEIVLSFISMCVLMYSMANSRQRSTPGPTLL
jgi:hypothetical protein